MRRLDHVAAGVEHDFGRLVFVGGAQRRATRASTSGDSCSREMVRVLRPIVLKYCCAPRRTSASPFFRFCCDPRHVDHEARVDPVIAGRDALAAIGADLRPALGIRRARAAGEQVEHAIDDRDRVCRFAAQVEPGRLDHRAGLDAFAAAGAGVEGVSDPPVKGIDE